MYQLSIIIPIYNVEDYIEECLESVLCQLPDFAEIVCINDGTPDKSMQNLKALISKQSKKVQNQFVLIDQENKGLSGARNTGINIARGKYIGFLDSDDKLAFGYFASIEHILKLDRFDIIDFNLITSKGEVLKTREVGFNSIFSLMNWFCPARLFKREFINKFQFTLDIYYEDIDLTPRLYLAANETYHIDACLYWYRDNQQSITKSPSLTGSLKIIESLEYILNNYIDLYTENLNPYYAIVSIQCYFLLCTAAHRRLGKKKAYYFLTKYRSRMKVIELQKLPLNLNLVDPKIMHFIKHPKLYLIAYNTYIKLKKHL